MAGNIGTILMEQVMTENTNTYKGKKARLIVLTKRSRVRENRYISREKILARKIRYLQREEIMRVFTKKRKRDKEIQISGIYKAKK